MGNYNHDTTKEGNYNHDTSKVGNNNHDTSKEGNYNHDTSKEGNYNHDTSKEENYDDNTRNPPANFNGSSKYSGFNLERFAIWPRLRDLQTILSREKP